MSLLHRALGGHEPLPDDDPTLRRLASTLGRFEPDPLFRRRLRGEVMNQYVAEREGHLRRPRQRREMGALGRAVLYASLGLVLSVSAAGAAADRALPGDLLYAVKLQLEDIRMRVAPPSFRDELAALAVAERLAELERLAAAGSWRLVPAAAARVTAAEEALIAIDPAAGGAAASRAVAALESVLAEAPPQAHGGLERALDRVSSAAARPAKDPTAHRVKGLRPDPQKPPPAAARPTPAPEDGNAEPKRRPESAAGNPRDR